MIVIIGFKHVGKTSLGKALATAMNLEFTDLDDHHELPPREIVAKHGEEHFRQMEREALKLALQREGVLALGGGTPVKNEDLLKEHTCLHITADPDQVFTWIEKKGFPAFYSQENPRQSFDELWEARRSTYESLATHKVHNHGDYEKLVTELSKLLS